MYCIITVPIFTQKSRLFSFAAKSDREGRSVRKNINVFWPNLRAINWLLNPKYSDCIVISWYLRPCLLTSSSWRLLQLVITWMTLFSQTHKAKQYLFGSASNCSSLSTLFCLFFRWWIQMLFSDLTQTKKKQCNHTKRVSGKLTEHFFLNPVHSFSNGIGNNQTWHLN